MSLLRCQENFLSPNSQKFFSVSHVIPQQGYEYITLSLGREVGSLIDLTKLIQDKIPFLPSNLQSSKKMNAGGRSTT